MPWLRIPRTLRRCLMVVAVLAALASCSTVKFYAQAAHGQWEMLHKARPIAKVLADPKVEAKIKTQLKLVQELREFARTELHLPVNKQFGDYSDLGRPYAVWVVFACPEFSVQPKGWWYPLLGTLGYRGFFDVASAKKEGEALKAQGYDVYVGGVDAYSTLGWFADPVLNTFLRRDDPELAELIFHELTHARVFLSGDTDFNEALATAVGQAGVRKWLRSKGRTADLAAYEQELGKEREIIALLLETRADLAKVYATPASNEKLREGKAEVFKHMQERYAQIKQRWTGDSRYDKFFARPINNAVLNTVATYYDLMPGFERLLKACDGNVDAFLVKVEAMKSQSPEKRRVALAKAP